MPTEAFLPLPTPNRLLSVREFSNRSRTDGSRIPIFRQPISRSVSVGNRSEKEGLATSSISGCLVEAQKLLLPPFRAAAIAQPLAAPHCIAQKPTPTNKEGSRSAARIDRGGDFRLRYFNIENQKEKRSGKSTDRIAYRKEERDGCS